MNTKKKKKYWEMNTAELAEATRKFDLPNDQLKPRKMPRRLKAKHDRILKAIRAKRGRPVVGEGAQRIQVTMERGLLTRADAYARRHGLTRAQLARAVNDMLAGAA